MTSKELIEQANKAFEDIKHKGYDRVSFISGYMIGCANVVGKRKQLREFKGFLQSKYYLSVSNRMIDEFEQSDSTDR